MLLFTAHRLRARGRELSTCDAAATMADAWRDDRLTMQTLRFDLVRRGAVAVGRTAP